MEKDNGRDLLYWEHEGIVQSVKITGNWSVGSPTIGNFTIWKRNEQKLTISPRSIHGNLKNSPDFTETGRIAVLSTPGINFKNIVDSVATNAKNCVVCSDRSLYLPEQTTLGCSGELCHLSCKLITRQHLQTDRCRHLCYVSCRIQLARFSVNSERNNCICVLVGSEEERAFRVQSEVSWCLSLR